MRRFYGQKRGETNLWAPRSVYSHVECIRSGYSWAMTERFLKFDRADVDALLPLPSATFHILVALADDDRHGYAIIQDVVDRTGGALRLSPGTLYRSIQRMLEQGLLVETRERPAPELDDERRRYYRITPLGTAVARAEARRLADLLKMARARGLSPAKG